jgi:hypothetical protein
LDNRRPLPIVAILLALLTVVALAPLVGLLNLESGSNPIDFFEFKEDKLELTRKTITIHTEFVSPEEMTELYNRTGETAENVLAFSQVINDKDCMIYSVTPENWDDHRALAMLGHEVLHCLGGEHS